MKPVLVVGADGFLGANLVPFLKARGHQCIALGGPSRTDGLDLRNRASVRERLGKLSFGSVVHLASFPDRPLSATTFESTVDVNVLGFSNLLLATLDRELDKFVFLGSYKQYGDRKPPFNETMNPMPNSAYAISKNFCESSLELFSRQAGLAYVSLRLSTVYGPFQDDEALLVPGTVMKCLAGEEIELTEGEQRRELTYVEDVCEAIALALEVKSARGAMNIGSGHAHTVREIVEAIHAKTGGKAVLKFGAIPYRANEVWEMSGDSTLARETLGWKPRFDLAAGLEATIGYLATKGAR